MTDREWLVVWTLQGCPRRLSRNMICTVPAAAFDMFGTREAKTFNFTTDGYPGRLVMGKIVDRFGVGMFGVGIRKCASLSEALRVVRHIVNGGDPKEVIPSAID